jgi:hypothetical protein
MSVLRQVEEICGIDWDVIVWEVVVRASGMRSEERVLLKPQPLIPALVSMHYFISIRISNCWRI